MARLRCLSVRDGLRSALIVAGLLVFTPQAEAGAFRLLLESNADAPGGSEVFAVTYATFADFIGSPASAAGSFSGIDISPGFSVVGFDYEFDSIVPVPEPATLSLMAVAGALVLAGRRRRRHDSQSQAKGRDGRNGARNDGNRISPFTSGKWATRSSVGF